MTETPFKRHRRLCGYPLEDEPAGWVCGNCGGSSDNAVITDGVTLVSYHEVHARMLTARKRKSRERALAEWQGIKLFEPSEPVG